MLKKILTLSLVAVMLSVTAFADLSAIDASAEFNCDAAITEASQANASIDEVAGLTGSVALTIDSDVVASDAIVVTAVFDGNTFLTASITPVALTVSDSNTATINLPTAKTEANTSYNVRFYLWESKVTLEPLAQPQAITVTPTVEAPDVWEGVDDVSIPAYDEAKGGWQISTAAELAWFSKLVDGKATDAEGNALPQDLDANAILIKDIYLNANGSTPTNDWSDFMMGYVTSKETQLYTGTFDGNTRKIVNYYCKTDSAYSGLFQGTGPGAVIKDLTFENAQHVATTTNTSGVYHSIVSGWAAGVEFKDITVSGSAKTDDPTKNTMNGFGTFVGTLRSTDNSITNCVSNVSVDASAPGIADSANLGIGGIVGQLASSATVIIDGCTNNGEINAPKAIRVGGIVGYVRSSCTIRNCTNNASITGYNNVGKIYGGKPSSATITDNDTNVLNGEVVTTK